MRVGELAALLATLDPDELVYVGSNHVRLVSREHAHTVPTVSSEKHECPDCGAPHRHLVHGERVSIAAGVALYGEGAGTWRGDDPPQVQYRGRWTRAARAAIDAHTNEPDR